MGKKIDRRRKRELGPQNIAARKAGRVISLTRREALIRQLDTAIGLWFAGRDAISIHLIVMAAHNCLCDLGFPSTIRASVGENHFGVTYDWLRHARSDPHDTVDFPPRTNEILLWECCIAMKYVFGGSTVIMDTFALYAALHRFPEQPNIREDATEKLPDGLVLSEIERLGLDDFLSKVMPVIANIKVRLP